MTDTLLKRTTVVSSAFFVVALTLIILFSINKKIEISDISQDEVAAKAQTQATPAVTVKSDELIFDDSVSNTEYLCIPLPQGTEADDIVIENHYMDAELYVIINKVSQGFYPAHALSGNTKWIVDGTFSDESAQNGRITLMLDVNGLYEYKSVLEDDELYISFYNPREVYEKIVVIDPVRGGSDSGLVVDGLSQKNIALDVAKKLKTLLDDSGIKAYYTRMDDVNPKEETRVFLANETKADMYVRIAVSDEADENIYGVKAVYNDEFFIPGFGNVELADAIEYELVSAVKGKALGLCKVEGENYALRHSTVPSVEINVGCLSNKQEANLLGHDDYIDKIAEGIYNGIMKAYGE